jgi:predicted nucleic acid-binding protein
MPVLIDSCGWIEMAANGPLAREFADHLSQPEAVIVPTLVQYETYRWLCRTTKKANALRAPVLTLPLRVIPLTTGVALLAAELASTQGLAMADAVVLATGVSEAAPVVTCDADLAGIPGVTFLARPKQG